VELAHLGESSDLDVGYVFFGREEIGSDESALAPLLERRPACREAGLAIVMEPTANAIEVGCLGNLVARVAVHGAAAHTARPWLGENAIHAAIEGLAPVAQLGISDVVVDGLTYREVASVATIEGGVAANVVPDRVRAVVNVRYAPTRSPAEAEARLRALLPDPRLAIEVLSNAPPGPVPVGHPLVARLREAGDLPLRPKQAWTPVAEFGEAGVPAVNLGPGDPALAHRDDERVEAGALVRAFDLLRAFLSGGAA
jgi:succinyl-diaminopimelate desuccinylase